MPKTSGLQAEIDELNDTIAEVGAILESAYEPETDRATAIKAIADALDLLQEPEDLPADEEDTEPEE